MDSVLLEFIPFSKNTCKAEGNAIHKGSEGAEGVQYIKY